MDMRAQLKAGVELNGQEGKMAVTAGMNCSLQKIGQRAGEMGQAGRQRRLQTSCLQKYKLQCEMVR